MSRFGFLEVPYERTTSFIKGASRGPGAVLRDWRKLEAEGSVPSPVATLSVPERSLGGGPSMISAVSKATADLNRRRALPVILGGEHTCTIGAVAALRDLCGPLGVIQLDAHADLRGTYEGSKYSHACVMRRVSEDLGVPVLPVGVRAYSRREGEYMRERAAGFIPGRRLGEWPVRMPPLLKKLPERTYLTIDMDYFDPAVVPGVGTPEPGGGEWHQTLDMLDAVMERKEIVGFDIVELCPARESAVSVRAAVRLASHLLAGLGRGAPGEP